jgi:hypothetical protein
VMFLQLSEDAMKLASKTDNDSRAKFAALITHECIHAFDYACETVGEHHPSAEFKCYSVQCLVQEVCFYVWEKQSGTSKKSAPGAHDRGKTRKT